MKKLSLLALGAAALAVAGFSTAASAHERDRFSFGIFLGGPPVAVEPPVVVEHDYNPEADYWAHRRWEEHERWEADQRELAREHCAEERERAEQAAYWRWHRWHDDD